LATVNGPAAAPGGTSVWAIRPSVQPDGSISAGGAAEPSIEAFHESLHRIQQAVPAQLKPSCMERGGTGPSPLEGSGGKKRNSSISL